MDRKLSEWECILQNASSKMAHFLFFLLPHFSSLLPTNKQTNKQTNFSFSCFVSGFVEKEIKRANIPIVDTGENPEVPFPRDMIDLEVKAVQLPQINTLWTEPPFDNHPSLMTFCPLLHLSGHLWEAGEWAEGNQHKPGGPEEEFSGADRAQAHLETHPAVLRWGQDWLWKWKSMCCWLRFLHAYLSEYR